MLDDGHPPMNPDEQPESPDADLVDDVRPIPSGVAKDMRTLECPPAGTTDRTLDAAAFVERAIEVLEEIEDALYDDLDDDGEVTALGVSAERNTVTGASGLILRRLMRRGRYSAPLAEIFSDTGRLDFHGKQRFCAFRNNAYRYGLGLWIHQAVVGERLIHAAFAIAREDENSEKFWYLARLLVEPFEIDQWRSPFLETGCGRPS